MDNAAQNPAKNQVPHLVILGSDAIRHQVADGGVGSGRSRHIRAPVPAIAQPAGNNGKGERKKVITRNNERLPAEPSIYTGSRLENENRKNHMNCGLVVDQASRIPVSTCNQSADPARDKKAEIQDQDAGDRHHEITQDQPKGHRIESKVSKWEPFGSFRKSEIDQ